MEEFSEFYQSGHCFNFLPKEQIYIDLTSIQYNMNVPEIHIFNEEQINDYECHQFELRISCNTQEKFIKHLKKLDWEKAQMPKIIQANKILKKVQKQ